MHVGQKQMHGGQYFNVLYFICKQNDKNATDKCMCAKQGLLVCDVSIGKLYKCPFNMTPILALNLTFTFKQILKIKVYNYDMSIKTYCYYITVVWRRY